MKKKYLVPLLPIALLGLAGCQSKSEVDNLPVTPTQSYESNVVIQTTPTETTESEQVEQSTQAESSEAVNEADESIFDYEVKEIGRASCRERV